MLALSTLAAALASVHALVHELQCAVAADTNLITGTGRRLKASWLCTRQRPN